MASDDGCVSSFEFGVCLALFGVDACLGGVWAIGLAQSSCCYVETIMNVWELYLLRRYAC